MKRRCDYCNGDHAPSSFDYVRHRYGVPARAGGRILYQGRPGVLTRGKGRYIRARMDGEARSIVLHPTWMVEYLDAQPLVGYDHPDSSVRSLAPMGQ